VNGHRVKSSKVFLKHAERVGRKIGITRVADISFLSPIQYPVYQACRPQLFAHSKLGQNTGGQGKGPNHAQARISAIMETIESFCAEPRQARLIRNTRDFLAQAHHVVDLLDGPLDAKDQCPGSDLPLMWTPVYAGHLQKEVLFPAEAVFFPFVSAAYKTDYFFAQGSNGLASGSSYLEAALHGFYEVIERHYIHEFEEGRTTVQALEIEDFDLSGLGRWTPAIQSEFELQIFSIQRPGWQNWPVILCLLVGDETHFSGWGCSGSLDISIQRAISEALQSLATFVSGAREDIASRMSDDSVHWSQYLPDEATLKKAALKKQVIDKKFSYLQSEYQFLMKWLKAHGFEKNYLANLSRVDVDVCVIKAFIPKMKCPRRMRKAAQWPADIIFSEQFSMKEVHG